MTTTNKWMSMLALAFLAFLPSITCADFTCAAAIGEPDAGSSLRTGTVTWKNTWPYGISAPYVRVEAKEGVLIRMSDADAWGKSIEFLATSASLPVNALKSGESGSLTFSCLASSDDGQLELSWTLSSDDAFPWSSIGSSLKPSYVTDGAWTFALANLKARFGSTWNTYLSRLRADANHLAELGRPVRRIDRLLQIEINNALGIDPVLPVLASVTDAARSARGMGLSFTRSYSSAMYGRFNKGILGYGWTDNLSTCAELSTDGKTLVFRVPGGGSYSFTKATGSWQPEDARDKTVLTEDSNAYRLKYQSGTVQTFAKFNMRTASIVDSSGNTLTFTWSGTTLQKITHTDGQSLTFAYSGGLLSSVTDDCGRRTSYSYSSSLLTKVTAPDGLETLYEYRAADGTAAARALSRIVYPDGTTREFAYDTSSGLVSAISVNGGKEKTTISRSGLNVTLTGPDGAVTTVSMGVSGETLKTTDALGGIATNVYTEDGLLKSVVSPSGLTGSITHDALGRVAKSVSAAGTATVFVYEEAFGNLKTVTDAKNHAVTYGYDAYGRGTSVTFADGSASRLEYNSRGDVERSTNRRGESITYAYDSRGRLTQKTWPNGRTFTYAYDAHDNVTKATDSVTGAVTMQYNSDDRLTKIVYPKGRGFTLTYDSCGRLMSRTSLDGAIERFFYDAAGRVASVTDGKGTVYLKNVYDEATGRLTKQVNGNGTSVSYLYDKLGRVVSIEHRDASGKIAESLQYCYDADGRCIRAASLLGEERYTYDKDGQLTAVDYPDIANETFAYDAVGNRKTANGATYSVNNLNQYTTVSGGPNPVSAITYDRDGNLTSLTDANGTTTYTYDTLNRLVAAKNAAAGIDWSCTYDVFGNRVSVTDNGVTTERIYLQGSLPSVAAEYVNGELKERHIVVGAVRVADISRTGGSPVQNEETRYYHADLIGSTRLVTDGDGTVIDRRAYKAFGETRTGGQTSVSTTAGYVGTLGVETDPTGLLFMRNRYYSPALGRFIQVDPIGHGGADVNLYRYCYNDSIRIIDISGLSSAMGFLDYMMNEAGLGDGVLGAGGTTSDAMTMYDVAGKLSEVAGKDLHQSVGSFIGNTLNNKVIGNGTEKFGRKLVELTAKTGRQADRIKAFGGTLGHITTVVGVGFFAYDFLGDMLKGDFEAAANTTRRFALQSVLAPGVALGELVAMGHHYIGKWMSSDKTETINITPNGGSSSDEPVVPDDPDLTPTIEDFELEDGSSKEVTVSGSFTISFECVLRIDRQYDYPMSVAGSLFLVDGVPQGGGTHYIDEDGSAREEMSVSVMDEGAHTLQWIFVSYTPFPVEFSVRNIKIVRSFTKYEATAKSVAIVSPPALIPIADSKFAKDALANSGIVFVWKRVSTLSTKAASPKILDSVSKGTTSSRLHCYERYVVVKDSSYGFALSSDDRNAAIHVSGLPAGFTFANGEIKGSASAAGSATLTITAKSSSGTATKSVPFVVVPAPKSFSQIKGCSVTFNANGGSGTMPAQRFANGVAQPLNANAFACSGYTFKGWARSADGDVYYADKQRVSFASDMTLYAVWMKNGGNAYLAIAGPGDDHQCTYVSAARSNDYLPVICDSTWTVSANVNWITLRTTGGYGSGKVYFDLSANSSAALRVGTITVTRGGMTYTKTIIQTGVPKSYSIRFNKNDGAGTVATKQFTCGASERIPSLKNGLGWARTGFVFKGWATSKANADVGKVWKTDWAYVKDGAAAGKTLDVWAVWGVAPGYYAIRFNKNDGSGAWRTVAFQHGKTKALPSCAKGLGWTRSGYAFVGWSVSAAKANAPGVPSNIWKPDQALVASPVASGKVLDVYAAWMKGYVVRYHKNTGETPEAIKTQGIASGVKTRLASLKNGLGWARTGFVLKGWATSPANARAGKVWKTDWAYVTDGAAAGKVLDVWAVWGIAPGYYAIRFNKNDGSGTKKTVAFPYGKSKALPTCAKGLGWTRSGHAFVGWSMSAAKANAPGAPSNIWKPDQALVASPVASGKVLDVYAAWVKGYVVRYHKNTGETPEAIKTQGIASGVKTRLASLKNGLGWARTGFVLKGWATSPANARAGKVWKTDWAYVTDGAAAGKTLDVWAVWGIAPGYYAIRFNTNGGSGARRTVAFKYGSAQALPSSAKGLGLTRSGYAFVGWSMSAAKANAPGVPSNIWKTDQALVSAPVASGEVLDVYAAWVKGYVVRYHKNTGETPEAIKTQGIPSGVKTRLASLKNGLGWARTGFVLKGWATSPANARAGKVWKTDWAYVTDGAAAGKTLDVWAVWGVAPGYYAIRFNKNDKSGTKKTVAFPYGKSKALPTCAKGLGWTRAGYAFVGWSMSAAKANAPGIPANIWKPDQALVASPVASGKVLDVYAAWVKGYVVRYHKNTGESPEAIKTQGIASGAKTRLAALKNGLGWARTGFVLKGWATSPANARAGKVWKTDWAYVTDGAAAGKTLDVWAVWGVAPGYYAIRFNKNDKSGTKKTVAFPYGTAKALPTCAKGLGWTRAGYAFVGWSVSAAKANAPGVPSNIWKPDQAVVSAPVSAGSVLDVHASWIKGYTIRFHKNTGATPEVVRSQGFQSGVRTRLPAVRNGLGWARAGFVFKGWATSKANAKAKKVWKTDWAYVTDATSLGKVLDVWAIWEGANAVGNDNFAYSRAISGFAGSVSASNKDATAERGEPLVKKFPYAVNSIWWSWTAPSSGTVRFSSSGTSFDTVMGVYSGSSLAGLATIAEDDDGGGNATSLCSFTATAGTVYHIAVAGYNNDSFGTIRLSWEMPGLKTATVQIQPTTNLSVTMRRTPFAADDSLVYAAGVLPDDGGMYFLAFDRSTGEGTVRLECDGMAEEFACEVVYADFEEEGFVVLLEDGEWLSL